MSDPIRTYITRDWQNSHRLILVQDRARGVVGVANDLFWTEYQEGDQFESSAGIGRADQLIQGIVDKAWDAGFRPAGYADVKNETAAISRHLEDFRSIAFHKLGIKS